MADHLLDTCCHQVGINQHIAQTGVCAQVDEAGVRVPGHGRVAPILGDPDDSLEERHSVRGGPGVSGALSSTARRRFSQPPTAVVANTASLLREEGPPHSVILLRAHAKHILHGCATNIPSGYQ